MLSFITMYEDFWELTPGENGTTNASIFNTQQQNLDTSAPILQTTEKMMVPTKVMKDTYFGMGKPEMVTQNIQQDVPVQYKVMNDNFGNQQVAKVVNGQIVGTQSIDSFMKQNAEMNKNQNPNLRWNVSQTDMNNAQQVANNNTSWLQRAKYMGNNTANWVYHNPVPAAALGAAGVYIAAQNRDSIRNAAQNFLPSRQPVGY